MVHTHSQHLCKPNYNFFATFSLLNCLLNNQVFYKWEINYTHIKHNHQVTYIYIKQCQDYNPKFTCQTTWNCIFSFHIVSFTFTSVYTSVYKSTMAKHNGLFFYTSTTAWFSLYNTSTMAWFNSICLIVFVWYSFVRDLHAKSRLTEVLVSANTMTPFIIPYMCV